MKTYIEQLHGDAYGQQFKFEDYLIDKQTPYQRLRIFDNAVFGRVMVLDESVQVTTSDEFIYHEMMVHTPMLAHGNAKKVLIIGGGDGGILREVCRYKNLEKVTMIEIDEEVINASKKLFPEVSAGAFEDPRLDLRLEDGNKFVNDCDERYDVIIIDSSDPVGPNVSLFQNTFYRHCHRCLNQDGIIVRQNGSMHLQRKEILNSQGYLKPLFKVARFYGVCVPTYIGGTMALAWASNQESYCNLDLKTLQDRYTEHNLQTKYYNPGLHQAAFNLPQYMLNNL